MTNPASKTNQDIRCTRCNTSAAEMAELNARNPCDEPCCFWGDDLMELVYPYEPRYLDPVYAPRVKEVK